MCITPYLKIALRGEVEEWTDYESGGQCPNKAVLILHSINTIVFFNIDKTFCVHIKEAHFLFKDFLSVFEMLEEKDLFQILAIYTHAHAH